MFCPKCKSEYREGYTMCIDCEIDLVDSIDSVTKSQLNRERINENIGFVPALTIHNIENISSIKQILEDRWIEYFFEDESPLIISGLSDNQILMVREDQVPSVIELLKDFEVKYMIHSTM
ncbi:MAG: hypothetical protein ACYC49_19795 [Ignavibacteriaceae bacterium]